MAESALRYQIFGVNIADVASTAEFLTRTSQLVLYTTSVPLVGLAIAISSILDVTKYRQIVGTCFANQNGSILIEFSADGTNFDATGTIGYIANDKAGIGPIDCVAPYLRVSFINGAVAQATFRFSILGKY
jgi:hypothetical protein